MRSEKKKKKAVAFLLGTTSLYHVFAVQNVLKHQYPRRMPQLPWLVGSGLQFCPVFLLRTASCEGPEQEDVVGQGAAVQAGTRNGYKNRGGTQSEMVGVNGTGACTLPLKLIAT